MHLLILGASGRTGVYGYKYALEQGHLVTVIVRKAEGIEPHKNLFIIEGSCLADADMQRAFGAAGAPVDAVLVFLNAQRVGQHPWGKFLGPDRLVTDATQCAIRALRAQQTSLQVREKPRLVIMSALGVGESWAVTPYIFRFVITCSNVSKSYDDHNAINNEIEISCGDDILWTIPLPVGLKDGGRQPVMTFGYTQAGASTFITRESCAAWMVDVAASKKGGDFYNKRVIISN